MRNKLFILVSFLALSRGAHAQIEYVTAKEVSQYEGKSYSASISVTLKSGFHFASSAESSFFAKISTGPEVPGFVRQITKPAYIETQIVRVSGVKTEIDLRSLSPEQRIVNRKYLDGLGRNLQEIIEGMGSAAKKDLISFNEYDAAGRLATTYLPYAANTQGQFQDNAVSSQLAFYATSNTSGKYAKDNAPYSQSIFDNSPVQMMLKEGSFGTNWQTSTGKVKQLSVRINTDADQVRLFEEDGSSTGFYVSGALRVAEIADEEGQKTLVFSDKEGKEVLKREVFDKTINGQYHQYKETYYIYSAGGFQSLILPPNVVANLKSNGWVLTAADQNNNIFRFIYDDNGRLIKQKKPSSAWVYTIYDRLDRPVLIQNGALRVIKKWYFIKYDIVNRPIMDGIIQDNQRVSYEDMKGLVDTFDYSDSAVAFGEGRGNSIEGYTNLSFPTTINSNNLLTIRYYDNYDIDNNGVDNYSYTDQGMGADEGRQGSAQGNLSVLKNRVVGGSKWLEKVLFYNINGQLIQQKGNNLISQQLKDAVTYAYNFDGGMKKSITKKNTSVEQKITESNLYDNSGRLKEINHQVNNGPVVTLATYNYNELGQLVDKDLNKLANNSYLQSVDYRYNIRGWLSRINNPNLEADDYNEEGNDIFGMELLYEKQTEIGNTGFYNGLISGIKWKSKMTNHSFSELERAYTYTYDKLGQLNDAVFKAKKGGDWNYMMDAFSEKGIKYDLNGNITSLSRYSWNINTNTNQEIDRLSYTYDVLNTDQLAQVSDGQGAIGGIGFKDLATEAKEYEFDEDGSLTKDKNKGIYYTYNEIGKVSKMSYISDGSKYIEFDYTSSGERIRKSVYQNGSLLKQQDYLDGFLYENNELTSVAHAEGRVRISAVNIKYEYFIRDHLQNVRVSFEEGANGQAEVRQESSYYAFGMQHAPVSKPGNANTALFNGGSEWLSDFDNDPDLYNTFYRQYDPVLGRFNGIDPMMVKYNDFSGYQFVFNNPVSLSDPSGADPSLDRFLSQLEHMLDGGGSGGSWTRGGETVIFGSDAEAFKAGADHNDMFNSWANTAVGVDGRSAYLARADGYTPTGIMLNEVNITAQKKNTSSAKEEDSLQKTLGKINGGLGAFSVGISAQNEIFDFAVRNNYKSARSWSKFGKLTSSQRAWRITNTLGKTGTKILRVTKGLGGVAAIAVVGITGVRAGTYYLNGGEDKAVAVKAVLDIVMTGVGFLGPIGFGVSATYFILDTATGGFGGYGAIE
ncbi:RHS repeat-associated core domain-containing protein [Pedobacter steynii]|uniref:RHS repeat-associated core domain-containing protein n=1 Tax=Pedobacter steynii TaxID=430522 RepID=A0A1G9SQI4_9SPHI|nr:DUF6443 domain-containing protein [Pedobacter steynii]NQX37352.1 hypothetical protein [Pedobacter steynii]SDM37607.1 RHS repeat-associated core domain-containing protein [Pedobacter steynii]